MALDAETMVTCAHWSDPGSAGSPCLIVSGRAKAVMLARERAWAPSGSPFALVAQAVEQRARRFGTGIAAQRRPGAGARLVAPARAFEQEGEVVVRAAVRGSERDGV